MLKSSILIFAAETGPGPRLLQTKIEIGSAAAFVDWWKPGRRRA